MSLPDLIAAFDDDALIALANKGVWRRAQKTQLEVDVLTYGAKAAHLKVGSFDVRMTDAGPQAAMCTCPATGMCSHIIASVLVLRGQEAAPEASPGPDQPGTTAVPDPSGICSAQDALVSMDLETVRKFAGADLQTAIRVSRSGMARVQGLNCQVRFEAPEGEVTFVSDQGLARALYKGPKTRKRMLVAAAAIAVRSVAGLEPPHDEPLAAPATQIDQETLAAVEDLLEQGVKQVFLGAALALSERLLDVAISAKAEAAPRLTGLLMRLSRMAQWADQQDIRFDDGRFLALAARAYAVTQSLKDRPADLALLGQARRRFEKKPPMQLWVLGATGWRTPAGARGVTLYALDPGAQRFHTGTLARGAGQDLGFSPSQAYLNTPLWSGDLIHTLAGHAIDFDTPHVSEDGQLSVSAENGASSKQPIDARIFERQAPIFSQWSEWLDHYQEQLPRGPLRGSQSVCALINPRQLQPPWFDDVNQRYCWSAVDASGQAQTLTSSAEDFAHLAVLHQHFPGALALLVQTREDADQIVHEPVALLTARRGILECTDLHFEFAPNAARLNRARDGLRWLKRRDGGPKPALRTEFVDAVLDQLGQQCRFYQPSALAQMSRRAEAEQLLLLSDVLGRLSKSFVPKDVLAAAYLVGEITALKRHVNQP